MFQNGKIHDVVVKDLMKSVDERGWLTELFRADEVSSEYQPVMGYVSVTLPDIARGPHEHVAQADYFAFIGPSNFKVYSVGQPQRLPHAYGSADHLCR